MRRGWRGKGCYVSCGDMFALGQRDHYDFLNGHLGRPFRALLFPSPSQGVALGYRMPPLWGFKQALKGRNMSAQGNALGKRSPNNSP